MVDVILLILFIINGLIYIYYWKSMFSEMWKYMEYLTGD